jgi:hypothetical protein
MVEILEFDPTEDYAKRSFDQPAVQRHLKHTIGFQKRIFMICGLKIGHGAQAIDETSRKFNVKGEGELSLAAKGGPTIAKGKGRGFMTKQTATAHNVNASHSFVFGYLLQEVKYNKKGDTVFTQQVKKHGVDDGHHKTLTTETTAHQLQDKEEAEFQCTSWCGARDFNELELVGSVDTTEHTNSRGEGEQGMINESVGKEGQVSKDEEGVSGGDDDEPDEDEEPCIFVDLDAEEARAQKEQE